MAGAAAPAVLAVGAMVCLGLSDFLNKRAMRAGVSRTEFLVVQSAFFTVTILILLPLMGDVRFSVEHLYAVACGVVTFVSYVFVLKALESGEASLAVPVYRMSFGVTVVLAVLLLDEAVTGRRLMGFALIVVALVALTAVGRERDAPRAHSSEGLPVGSFTDRARSSAALAAGFALVAMVTVGTKGFLYKVGVGEGAPPTTFALVQSLTFLPIAVAYAYAKDGRVGASLSTLNHAPYNGVLTAMASVLLLMSLEEGDASVSVPISQLCFVVTAVLAVAVWRERVTPWKAVGVVAAVAAVLVLSSALPLPWGL